MYLPGQNGNNNISGSVRLSGKDLKLWHEICVWKQRLQQPKMTGISFRSRVKKTLTENGTDIFGVNFWWDFKCPSGLKLAWPHCLQCIGSSKLKPWNEYTSSYKEKKIHCQRKSLKKINQLGFWRILTCLKRFPLGEKFLLLLLLTNY